MPGTAAELSRIFSNLFGPHAQKNLVSLRNALQEFRRDEPNQTRKAADKVLKALNGGKDPQLTKVQLTTLKKFLTWRELEPVSPLKRDADHIDGPLVEFYKETLQAPFDEIQILQTALFEAVTYHAADNLAEAKACLRRISPSVRWTEEKIAALELLLVRDQTFRALAPYSLDTFCW